MKKRKAAALRYDEGDYAPRVLARGIGDAAKELCRIARESGVPIVESPDLTDSMMNVEPFAAVPEEYWVAVAEILSFVYETRTHDELH